MAEAEAETDTVEAADEDTNVEEEDIDSPKTPLTRAALMKSNSVEGDRVFALMLGATSCNGTANSGSGSRNVGVSEGSGNVGTDRCGVFPANKADTLSSTSKNTENDGGAVSRQLGKGDKDRGGNCVSKAAVPKDRVFNEEFSKIRCDCYGKIC